jgi:integrase
LIVDYVAKRIRFRNGERHSVLQVTHGLPIQEVTLYLGKYRRKGRAANTIHFVCLTLALLYRELGRVKVDLLGRLTTGQFLTIPELNRLASAAQFRVDDLDDNVTDKGGPQVINLSAVRFRRGKRVTELKAVDVATQASRLRYMADYLGFLSDYVGSMLPESERNTLRAEKEEALAILRANIPEMSRRAKLNARVGLSEDETSRLLAVVHPDSPNNPWKRGFVCLRNWLIVVLLLATGMRRGELLGLQIGDLHPSLPKLRIIRRADAAEDLRRNQPNTKTNDREIELTPALMQRLWSYINTERRAIKAARKIPQIFVADEGEALSQSSIDKLFRQLREACPDLPVRLTSHVMRHTWNDRFSEQAEELGLSDAVEEKARNLQQGWSDNSVMAAIYTRRYTARKGRQVALKLQERLDERLNQDK